MKLKLLFMLVTACSAGTISRNDVSPLSAQPSGGSEYLPLTHTNEYSVAQIAHQESPQYLPPESLNQQQTYKDFPPVEAKQTNPQFTPISDSVEILNPDFFPNNLEQYQTPATPPQQSMEYYQPQQNNLPVSNVNIYPISQNTYTLPNQYLPSTDNSKQVDGIYSLPEDGGYYSKQYYRPYEHNINSEVYLPPSNIGVTSYQYILPANNAGGISNKYIQPTDNVEVVSNQYIPPVNNVEVVSNHYAPPTNNGEDFSNQYIPPVNNVEVVSNQYIPTANNVEVISNQYTPSSNDVEIISSRNAAQNDVGPTPQQYVPQIDTKIIKNNNNEQHNFNLDFEPQKLFKNEPNINSQNQKSQSINNDNLPAVTDNSLINQYNQQSNQKNYNEYLPPMDSNLALNQFNGHQNSDQITNTMSNSKSYSRTVNSPNDQYIQPNIGQNLNVYPLLPNTKSVQTEYVAFNSPANQYIQTKNTPEYFPPTDTKSVPNQYLPVIDSNSQIKQYNESPVQIKQNSNEYLSSTSVNTVNSKFSPLKNEYLPTVSEATRRYGSAFSKPSTIYNFNTISSTPYPYSYTFSTPATISSSQNDYYRSAESSRTDRPDFKYSSKLTDIGKSTNSVTTPRSFETFKINSRAQSRQSYANSRSSAIGILSGSQQTDKFESFPVDQSKFGSNHLNQNNNNPLRTSQPLDSNNNLFQLGNQQESDHSSQRSYSNPHSQYTGHPTESVPILKQISEMAADGSFSYETLTGDQTHVMQQGHIENLGTDHEEQVIHGSYSYIGDDGKTYTVTYVADANGFRAVGDHIPTPPPIPDVIQRSIEFNLAEEIAKSSSTPGYQYGQGNHNNNQAYTNPEQIRERSSYSKESGYKY